MQGNVEGRSILVSSRLRCETQLDPGGKELVFAWWKVSLCLGNLEAGWLHVFGAAWQLRCIRETLCVDQCSAVTEFTLQGRQSHLQLC